MGGAQSGEHLTTWEASKITFHADRNCMLDNRTLLGKLNRNGQERGNCGRPYHSHCQFGLRQVGLLHARQAHGWSWTLQLQHELWLQLQFFDLCVRLPQSISKPMTSHELPSLATTIPGTTGGISLAADLDKSKRMANGTPRIQAFNKAQLRFSKILFARCLMHKLLDSYLLNTVDQV